MYLGPRAGVEISLVMKLIISISPGISLKNNGGNFPLKIRRL